LPSRERFFTIFENSWQIVFLYVQCVGSQRLTIDHRLKRS
jgi:hypothetical protein